MYAKVDGINKRNAGTITKGNFSKIHKLPDHLLEQYVPRM